MKDWFGLVARLVTGGVWIVAGALKLPTPRAASAPSAPTSCCRRRWSRPWTTCSRRSRWRWVAVGVGLVLGLLTRASALVSSLLFVAFVVGIAAAWARGLQIDCGCFGLREPARRGRCRSRGRPARRVGGRGRVDEAEVRPLIEDQAFEQDVVHATDQMSRDGVIGTPTVLIDGQPAGETPQESVQAVLDVVSGPGT